MMLQLNPTIDVNSMNGIEYLETIKVKEKFPSTNDWYRKFAVLKCFCGNIFKVRIEKYKSGKVKSCGCSRYKYTKSKLPNGEVTLNRIYNIYLQNSKKKNRQFSITKDEFKELIHKPCYYCNRVDVNLVKTKFENCRYNGIDRLDSSIGYISENIVTCCGDCNRAKNALTEKDFLNLIKLIHDKHFKA